MGLRGIAANELARAAYWRQASTLKILPPCEVRKRRDLVRALVASARKMRLETTKGPPQPKPGRANV